MSSVSMMLRADRGRFEASSRTRGSEMSRAPSTSRMYRCQRLAGPLGVKARPGEHERMAVRIVGIVLITAGERIVRQLKPSS